MLGALLAAASLAVGSGSTCERPLPGGPQGLPPLVFRTTCGAFALDSRGSIGRAAVGREWPRWAPPGSARIAHGTYMGRRGQFLTVYRDGRRLWRSSRPYRFTESIAAGRRFVAFSVYRGALYVATLRAGDRERPVLAGEQPVGFTHEGLLLTSRWRGRGSDLRLRRLDGSLVAVIARSAPGHTFEQRSRLLLYVSRDHRLVKFDGRHRTTLGDLPTSGVYQWPAILEGRLVAVFSRGQLDVFRLSGSRFASARWHEPKGSAYGTSIDGSAIANKAGDAVGIILKTRGKHLGYRKHIAVAFLRAGAKRPTVVHRDTMPLSCGGTGYLSWHGHWLLFTGYDQQVVAIDTVTGRKADLTQLVRRLPGRRGGPVLLAFWVDWRR